MTSATMLSAGQHARYDAISAQRLCTAGSNSAVAFGERGGALDCVMCRKKIP